MNRRSTRALRPSAGYILAHAPVVAAESLTTIVAQDIFTEDDFIGVTVGQLDTTAPEMAVLETTKGEPIKKSHDKATQLRCVGAVVA
jgi:hypothetical protein